MTRDEARKKADTIINLFWHNFQKSEPAFIMRDVIAIALENADAQTELPRFDPREAIKPDPVGSGSVTFPKHYDSEGYCDSPGRGY